MQKSLIFKDNKDKSFVYRWINKLNNKEYLGSTANAKRRLLKYYDLSSLKLANMPIYKAILKHGHSNFIFEIIEYCEPNMVLEREQYYLDNFDFDYNVLEKADSIFGYKHTEEARLKMVNHYKDKNNHHMFGKTHSEEALALISKPGELNPMFGRKHSEATRASMSKKKNKYPLGVLPCAGLLRRPSWIRYALGTYFTL